MKRLPRLETEVFVAYIADNAPCGIHRRGYNGVASLIPRHSGNNLLVPMYAGLNYETISLTGLPPYEGPKGSRFEPRCEPMYVDSVDGSQVILAQPETSHAHVSARITFSAEEPHYLHQHIELTFHRRFCEEAEKSAFHSLWASYIHAPPDLHIYLKRDWQSGSDLQNWFGITKADHDATWLEVRPLPEDRELTAQQHLEEMTDQKPLTAEEWSDATDVEWSPMALPKALNDPCAFYYGFCHGSQMFLVMFKQPERFRPAYSPCGAGKQPAWNPAWDFVLHLDDARPGTTYAWDLCLVTKEFGGRADVLDEVRRYLG